MEANIKRKSIAISMPLAFMLVISIFISSCQKKIDQPTEVVMVNNSSDYFKVSQEQFQQHKNFLTIINNINQSLRNDTNLDKELEAALVKVNDQQISLEPFSINDNCDSVYIHLPSFIVYLDVLDSMDYLVQTLIQFEINNKIPQSISSHWALFKEELEIDLTPDNVKLKKGKWCCVTLNSGDIYEIPCKQYYDVSEWWAEVKCAARSLLYLTTWWAVSEGDCEKQDLCP